MGPDGVLGRLNRSAAAIRLLAEPRPGLRLARIRCRQTGTRPHRIRSSWNEPIMSALFVNL